MSLGSSIFSSAQARVLAWIFGQPERWFHVNELLRLTGLGSASLQRELARLTEGGLVSAERVGNLRRFRADPQSPVFSELTALVYKTLAIVPILQQALEPLRQQTELVLIFGSVARQEDHAGSDIDLLVVSDALTTGDVLERVIGAEETLGRKVNPTCYTPADFRLRLAQPHSFVNKVLAQPTLPLWGEVPAARTGVSA